MGLKNRNYDDFPLLNIARVSLSTAGPTDVNIGNIGNAIVPFYAPFECKVSARVVIDDAGDGAGPATLALQVGSTDVTNRVSITSAGAALGATFDMKSNGRVVRKGEIIEANIAGVAITTCSGLLSIVLQRTGGTDRQNF